MSTRSFVVGLLAALLCACADPRPDMERTDQLTQEILGQPATWVEGPEDRSVDSTVGELLARPLSVEDAIRVALLRNMRLQAIYEDLGVAQAELVAATLPRNPTMEVDVLQPDVRPKGTALELELAQDLISVLTIPGRRAVAEAQLEQTRARVTAEVVSLAAEVRAAYFHLQGALQTRSVLRRVVETSAASLEYAEAIHRVGNLTDLELANQRAQMAEAEVELAQAELAVVDTRERMNLRMGLWGDETGWSIPDQLPDLPADEPTLEHLESLAVARRLDLQAAQASAEALRRSLELTRRFRWTPGISVGAAADRDSDGQWAVGSHLEVTLPVFDHGQADVARQEAQLRQAEKRFAALAVEVRAEVRRLRGRILALSALARSYRDRLLPARREVLQRSLEQYSFMFIGTLELLLAKRNEVAAERDFVRALEEYWVTSSELTGALGGRSAEGQGQGQGTGQGGR